MKSSIITKEESKKYKIDEFYKESTENSADGFVEKLLLLSEELKEEEKRKIDQILDAFFLGRKEKLELSRKFRDFFDQELEKAKKTPSAQKFFDFLLIQKIAGSHPRKKGVIVDPSNELEVKPIDFATNIHDTTESPKIIRNDNGEVSGIEVRCSCGEIIHIDVEFE